MKEKIDPFVRKKMELCATATTFLTCSSDTRHSMGILWNKWILITLDSSFLTRSTIYFTNIKVHFLRFLFKKLQIVIENLVFLYVQYINLFSQ